MTQQRGGTKRSSWLTFRRRLLLIRMLLRGAAGSAELIAAVQAELGDEGYPPAAAAALKHDLTAGLSRQSQNGGPAPQRRGRQI